MNKVLFIGSLAFLTSCGYGILSEPKACFEASAEEVELFETVQFTNCSENAETYEWEVETEFFTDDMDDENIEHSWTRAGSYKVELTAFTKKERAADDVSIRISVIDICYTCVFADDEWGQWEQEYCASNFGFDSREDFEDYMGDIESQGLQCELQ